MRRTLLACLFALVLTSCDGGVQEGQDAQTTTPEATASGSTEPVPTVVTVDDLVGTWKGNIFEPARNATYSVRVTIRQCDPGDDCGRMVTKGSDALGSSQSCTATLTYEGPENNGFRFQETIESGNCATARIALTPMPGGYAIGVEEYWEGRWGTYGALLAEAHSIQ